MKRSKNSSKINERLTKSRGTKYSAHTGHSYKADYMKQSVLRVATDNSSKIISHSLKKELTLA